MRRHRDVHIENMGKYYIPLTHTTECTMTGYHDYVLGAIPAFVLGPIVASPLVGLSLQIAVAVGGAAAALLVGHALFVRGPVPNRSTETTARVSTESQTARQVPQTTEQNAANTNTNAAGPAPSGD
jgi:hypothetical protein